MLKKPALKIIITVFCFAFLLLFPNYLHASEFDVDLVFEEPITSGAVHKEYHGETSAGKVKIDVLRIDLSNPNVKIDVISGKGRVTERLNVSAMAENTGAVGAMSGDMFNTRGEGAPLGPMVTDGRWITSPSKLDGLYSLGITNEGKAYINRFEFDGRVVSREGSEFPLAGLNKAPYWEETGNHSHAHQLHLYDDNWAGSTRGEDTYTTPTEVAVKDGRVTDISEREYLTFDNGVPNGVKVLRGHGEAAKFLTDNFEPGDEVVIDYSFSPAYDWSMVVGGHGLLVDNGEKISYTRDLSSVGGVRARAAVGVSKDARTLYMVGVQGGSNESRGLSIDNLSDFFVKLGAWKALNLDGGGSAAMVARPLGEWDVKRVFEPEQGQERLLPNSIGIYSEAPEGEPAGLILDGENILLVGERTSYELKGYDQYYNPFEVDESRVNWHTNDIIEFENGEAVAKNPGSIDLLVEYGSISAALPLKVLGKSDIEEIAFSGTNESLGINKEYDLDLNLETTSGHMRNIPFNLVDWEFYGVEGSVSNEQQKVTVDSLYEEFKEAGRAGFIVARYDDFSVPYPVVTEEFSFSDSNPAIRLTVGQTKMEIGDEEFEMDVTPAIINGRTVVPVRFVSQALGSEVMWSQSARRVSIIRDKTWIDLWPEDEQMIRNGRAVWMDQEPVIMEGRTMLPLRAIGEALDLEVHWDAETRNIYLQ